MEQLSGQTLVFDVEGGLLRSSSTFPYFMLVALEAGGFLRGLLLLLLYPLLCCLSHEVGLRVMVMVCFFGIRKEGLRAGRAVLPKFFLEDLGLEGFEVLRKGRRRVCFTSMPRVMVEWFLKEYLGVEEVVGRELKEFGGYYTGLMEEESKVELETKELFGENDTGEGAFGFGSCTNSSRHHLFSHCKEVHVVTEAEKRTWQALPREQYPKPLAFHDGRVAFRPTPMNTLIMFLWIPLGVFLTIIRSVIFLLLPYKMSIPVLSFSGMKSRLIRSSTFNTDLLQPNARGHLYVCNHRTLLDPLYISAALDKLVTAVTYSISPVYEKISPIRTVRLTRDKEEDRRRMAKLLKQGDLVVCPEGTTCREPYLLRFSPLFTELTDTVVPVALVSRVSMFYGTTATGFKFLDPFYFLANPRPEYSVEFLEEVPTHSIAGDSRSSYEVANHVQSKLGSALGFECTTLTRKDKYRLLAGNEGIVNTQPKTRAIQK